jgi:hypothetical protein
LNNIFYFNLDVPLTNEKTSSTEYYRLFENFINEDCISKQNQNNVNQTKYATFNNYNAPVANSFGSYYKQQEFEEIKHFLGIQIFF